MIFFDLFLAKYFYLSIVLTDVLITSLGGIVSFTGTDILLITLINMADAIILYIVFVQKDSFHIAG